MLVIVILIEVVVGVCSGTPRGLVSIIGRRRVLLSIVALVVVSLVLLLIVGVCCLTVPVCLLLWWVCSYWWHWWSYRGDTIGSCGNSLDLGVAYDTLSLRLLVRLVGAGGTHLGLLLL